MKNRLIKIFTNKYFIAALGLLVWITFFDPNHIFSQLEARQQLRKLREEKNYYREKIEEVRTNYKELSTDPRTMEKFARERYYMKKANEDIYLIVEEERKKERGNSWIPQTLLDFFSKEDETLSSDQVTGSELSDNG